MRRWRGGERSRASPNSGGNGRTSRSRLCRALSSQYRVSLGVKLVSDLCWSRATQSPRPSLSFSLPILHARSFPSVLLSLFLYSFLASLSSRYHWFVSSRDPFEIGGIPISRSLSRVLSSLARYTYMIIERGREIERVPQCGVVTVEEHKN